MPGAAFSTASKIPKYVTNRMGATGEPYGTPVSTALDSPTSPSSTSLTRRSDIKLIVLRMRSASSPSSSIRLPRRALLTLLNADLTSMNRAPATFLSLHAFCVRFIKIATASTHDRRFRHPN